MKKIIIADHIKDALTHDTPLLDRPALAVFTAHSHEEMLKIHRAEKVDLIITLLYLPGMSAAGLCSLIRADRNLRRVSVIICSRNYETHIAQSEQCRANAVMTLPINPQQLREKARELLSISSRGPYRVLCSIRIEGHNFGKPFYCSSENISASGMLIETDRDLDEGDTLECSFVLPDSTRTAMNGEIVRVVKRSNLSWYAVKFNALSPETKCAIESFVEKKNQIKGQSSPRFQHVL